MPADRALRNYFAENRQCGSKDRRFIGNCLYALYRWYGWIGSVIPETRPDEPIDCPDFCKAVALAFWLEGDDSNSVYLNTLEKSGLDLPPTESELDAQAGIISGIIGSDISVSNLVPSWFKAELSARDYEALQSRPPVWIRIRKDYIQEVVGDLKNNDVEFTQHAKVRTAVSITKRANLAAFKTFRAGYFEIQDLASQCLAYACIGGQGESWLDICAGAGGKSLALADQMNNNGLIVASDKRTEVLKEAKRRARKAHVKIIRIESLDSVYKNKRSFDGVLVDSPCSCSGTWRRNPEARWIAGRDVSEKAAKTQLGILQKSCSKVKAGGVLVYTTCSMSPVENEEVVSAFLKKHPEFTLEPFSHPLTGEELSGMMYVHSWLDDSDTMFAARMVRSKN
jgi:16S rRNA (cytosine967-C5)-methyltransferase